MSRSVALTPGQRGLWFLHVLRPQDPAYNTCTAIELLGPLHPAALRTAVTRVGLRHDTLRAAFPEADGDPRQVTGEDPPPLRLVDLTALPAYARDAELDRQLRRLAGLPFDLRRGPVARWWLLRCGPRRHVLVFDAHHIVFDRDSLALICRELDDCYAGCVLARPLPSPAGHDDTALVAQAWGHGAERLAPDLAFWRSQLVGVHPYSQLFGVGPAAPAGREPIRHTARYDHDDLRGLAGLCAAETATPFMAVLALLGCVLGRYTGQPDAVLGAPISLRRDGPPADAVGLLVNVVPLRLRLAGRPSLRSLLRQARDVVLDVLEHGHVALHRIIQVAGAARGDDPDPLFQVLLVYQRQASPPRLAGVTTTLRPVPAAAAKYPLTVTVTETAAGLDVDLDADASCCDPADLVSFAGHLTALVRAAGREPDAPVDDVALVGAAERARVQRQGTGPQVPRDPATGLHALVAAAVPAHADAVALVGPGAGTGTAQVTYATAYRAASRLAALLRTRIPTFDRPVAVLQHRGVGIPVSYLAVLIAGGTVLPLEPSDPDERLATLLATSGAVLVLTHRDLRERCERLGVSAVAVEDFLRVQAGRAVPAAAPAVHPEQAAYVLFTSGSTGTPKGVVVPHRGIVNRVLWMQEALRLAPGERVLFKTSTSFDVSVPEMFWPLTCGGVLVVAEPGGERDPRYLVQVIGRERIAYTHFVPSMLAPFLAEAEAGAANLTSLRLMACSGEALPDVLSRRVAAVLGAELYNLYGPTEASVDVLAWRCDPSSAVALGRPIANTGYQILDDRMRPVPGPAVGEIHLGGDCLARGYLDRPGLTAAAFLPARSGGAGRRLYRTGDYARRGHDGVVHLIGRRDHQVKVLGRRVELGEVSEAFRRQPGVLDAAVVARGNQLVAFVVGEPGAAAPETLLSRVRAQLPGYLVPAVVEPVARLPLTRNGKVDLGELGRRAAGLAPRRAAGTAPRTALEAVLASAYRGVLGVAEIGVHDGFFDAGGDSMALLRLHRRLVADVAPELTVRELFRFPTVAALAEHLADRGAAVAGARNAAAAAAGRAERRRVAMAAGHPSRRPVPGATP